MLAATALIVVGLALLTVASDHFVTGAARIATVRRIAPVVIGAVIIGFGTSAPEMLVSVLAAASGQTGVAVGNILGSSHANLALILGVGALIVPLTVESGVLRREVPVVVGLTALFAVLLAGGLTLLDGLLLVAVGAATTWWMLAGTHDDTVLEQETVEFVEETPETIVLRTEVVRTVLGLLGTLAGAQMLVSGATTLAEAAGLSATVIGLTVVAVGTSLPELASTVQAARKRETDLIIGNLWGSCLFNLSIAAGAAAIVGPTGATDRSTTVPSLLALGVTVAAAVAMLTGRRVGRREGAVLVVVYVAGVLLMV